MLGYDPEGKTGPNKPLPDQVTFFAVTEIFNNLMACLGHRFGTKRATHCIQRTCYREPCRRAPRTINLKLEIDRYMVKLVKY